MTKESYFWEADLEFMACIDDIKDHQFVLDLKYYSQHVHSTRYVHSFTVAYYSFLIAKRLGWDEVSTARAGLLHDLFYYHQGEVTFSKGTHLRNHPQIALINARIVTDLNPIEEDIIIKHMWLATSAFPNYKESYIVTFVDKYVAVDEFARPSMRQVMRAFFKYLRWVALPTLRLHRNYSPAIDEDIEDIEETLEGGNGNDN